MGREKKKRESHQRETIHDKFATFVKIGKVKNVNRVSKIRVCMYVGYVLKGFLCLFPGDRNSPFFFK